MNVILRRQTYISTLLETKNNHLKINNYLLRLISDDKLLAMNQGTSMGLMFRKLQSFHVHRFQISFRVKLF